MRHKIFDPKLFSVITSGLMAVMSQYIGLKKKALVSKEEVATKEVQ